MRGEAASSVLSVLELCWPVSGCRYAPRTLHVLRFLTWRVPRNVEGGCGGVGCLFIMHSPLENRSPIFTITTHDCLRWVGW
jgi:hypothetical protein